MREQVKVGAILKIRGCIKRNKSVSHLYSRYGWPYEVYTPAEAEDFLRNHGEDIQAWVQKWMPIVPEPKLPAPRQLPTRAFPPPAVAIPVIESSTPIPKSAPISPNHQKMGMPSKDQIRQDLNLLYEVFESAVGVRPELKAMPNSRSILSNLRRWRKSPGSTDGFSKCGPRGRSTAMGS